MGSTKRSKSRTPRNKSTIYGDTVAELTHEWLQERRWTQQDLATKLGQPQSFVCKVLKRERVNMDIDLLVAIVEAFEIPLPTAWEAIDRRVKQYRAAVKAALRVTRI